jgi:hypothetical protein
MSSLTPKITALALASIVTITAVPSFFSPQTTLFTEQEISSIKKFWSQSGRHVVTFLPGSEINGPYAPRQTPDGSTWLLNYFRARGNAGKVVPGKTPEALNDRQKQWDAWIEGRYSWDEYTAALEAYTKNKEETNGSAPAPTLKPAADPGPIPADLLELAADPPRFVTAVTPRQYRTDFGDYIHTANDNVPIRRKYAYYRFSEGVMDPGTPIRPRLNQLRPLFTKAGLDDSAFRIFSAVSSLEGGFESVNTYDTGFVSVGFIQFASLKGGSGSLGQVLLSMKTQFPGDFQNHFRKYGLDVTPKGELVALNLETGEPKIGPDANTEIITNRRYPSVFVRAGVMSEPFRIAQIKTAMDQYYPANDTVTFNFQGKPTTARIKDFILTEAGMATFMDRKVNTGKYGDLVTILENIAYSYDIKSIRDLAKLEYQIIRAMKWRDDCLEPKFELSKPRDLGLTPSRGGSGRNIPPRY